VEALQEVSEFANLVLVFKRIKDFHFELLVSKNYIWSIILYIFIIHTVRQKENFPAD